MAESLVFDVPRVNLSTLKLALYYDLATEKDGDLPTKAEKSERALMTVMRRCQKPIALFVDDGHDLHAQTLRGLKQFIEKTGRRGSRLTARLSEVIRATLDQLIEVDPDASQSEFDRLKAGPSGPGVKHLQKEIAKLQALRRIGISEDALADVPFKVLQALKRRAQNEHASKMREHPDRIRYTLMACFVHVRTMDVTDDAVCMMMEVIRRIDTQTEKQLHKELLQDIKKVSGKVQLLFRIAEAVVEDPQGSIPEVIFPQV